MISVCVPTKNRAAFLARLLRYWVVTGFSGRVLIGDSSDEPQARATREAVDAVRGRLAVRYAAYPDLSSCECIERLSQTIDTPYAVFVGDDDFLCPRGLAACIEFLERHPKVNAVHGQAVILYIDRTGAFGRIAGVSRYPQATLSASTGAGRLHEFLTRSPYAMVYAVHRTATWRAMFEGVSAMAGTTNRNLFKDELMATCVSAIRGPIAQIDALSLVRQSHDGIYKHLSTFDWLTDEAWLPSYRLFRDRLVDELARQDGLATAEATAVVKDVVWRFLADGLSRESAAQRRGASAAAGSGARRWLARVPGARRAWAAIRDASDRRRHPWSLAALRHPSSRYYPDFCLIDEALIQPPSSSVVAASTLGTAKVVACGSPAR